MESYSDLRIDRERKGGKPVFSAFRHGVLFGLVAVSLVFPQHTVFSAFRHGVLFGLSL